MATGDAAAAAGMAIMTGAEPANTLDTEVNLTRDYIAQRTSTVTPVAKGGTGSTTAVAARAALGITSLLDTKLTRTSAEYSADFAARDTAISNAHNRADAAWDRAGEAKDGQMFTSVYGRTLSGGFRSLYVSATGLLGWVSSSRRHKKSIRLADVDPRAVLNLDLVTFLYKAEIDTDNLGELQYGLIAEDVHDAGLTWLVDYGEDGIPEGVRYDRLALALLPLVQHLDARLTALEEHA